MKGFGIFQTTLYSLLLRSFIRNSIGPQSDTNPLHKAMTSGAAKIVTIAFKKSKEVFTMKLSSHIVSFIVDYNALA